ncbi:glycosyltransferase family 2 protein [Salinibacter ruber]|uniref:glycosyltransferase family 2 protein n=1 Tax=Salinibacter ruber TaxID=146919 RepID=UPI002169D09D|nr:glycosyltransferase family 2 protein [Salinibacter ruber]MCS4188212.1 glycosyltransferase involved in cell wall biosynthesis [Salinibacter ruber]
MEEQKDISVCIPTCNRPDYLRKAIESVIRQDPGPREIVIGDDSKGEAKKRTKKVVHSFEKEKIIKYTENERQLGESKNVEKITKKSSGKYIVLLHDDDRMVKGSLDKLYRCVEKNEDIVAAFGKQYLLDSSGSTLKNKTKKLNRNYFRVPKKEGVQESPVISAITQQFPGDGYIIKSDLIKEVGYYHQPKAGDAPDSTFAIEMAKATNGCFYFTDEFTAKYCLSEESVTRGKSANPDNAYRSLKIVLDEFPDLAEKNPDVQEWLRRRAPAAVLEAAEHGHLDDAFRWFFSRYHRQKIPTLGGIRRLLVILKESTVGNLSE